MKKDSYKTDVIFRRYPDNDFNLIIALFPYIIETNHFCMSYMHVGQHSGADYNGVINSTIPAKEEKEYIDLYRELESLGYDLNVIQKRNYSKYLKAYNESKRG